MRFVPLILGLVISFVSDTSYTINDVRETLPGYLALLLHILSTGAFEHFKSLLVPTVGSKYISVCCTVGAAVVSLIAYTTRELLVGRSRLYHLHGTNLMRGVPLRRTYRHHQPFRFFLFWPSPS